MLSYLVGAVVPACCKYCCDCDFSCERQHILQGLTVGGLGIGAGAVSAFRGFLRKQPGPITAQTVTQGTAEETEEQRQQRLYEEESRRLANELREFDAQLESKDEDAYKRKLKREGLWRD